MLEKIGLIPCAGRGSRLSLPFSKELFPNVYTSHYSPIILYTINALKKAGIDHLIITINPQKVDILNFLGNGNQFGVKISYCVHPKPLSLPHSINEACHLIKDKIVVFSMPDTFVQPSDFLKTLLNTHQNDETSEVTMAGFKTDNPTKFGMVEFSELTGKVKCINDKPSSTNLKWMWGAMVWNPEFTEVLHQFIANESNKLSEKELILTDALKPLIIQNRVNLHCYDEGRYRDLGTYDEIKKWSKEE